LASLVAVVGVALACSWSLEARRAGFLADHLTRATTKVESLPAWVTPPSLRWWQTTAGHLMIWAFQRDQSATDPASVEEVRELLAAATQASPVHASVRFALARVAGQGGETANLGLSRDAVALAWMGRQRLAAGRKEAGLKLYHAALAMAAQTDPARPAMPAFNDDPQIRRYTLPAEDLIGPIVRELAAESGLSYPDWSAALPPEALVRLVAVRVLRERASADADAALDVLLAHTETPASPTPGGAVAIAARAEALALKGRWDEAAQCYRQAIDLMPESTIRRSWWMNLAEITLRLNDETQRQQALEAARGNDTDDEITRRAIELLRYHGARSDQSDAQAARNAITNRLR
jgi:tetratricopeptide (TPR) repeat protein